MAPLAFDIFAKAKVDIAIVEVGLGGRLDSTNIIIPLLSVITNIGWDHMNILGDKLELIATEKAGIIKPGVPVIIGEYQPEIAPIFLDKAEQEKSRISFASQLLSGAGAKTETQNPGPGVEVDEFLEIIISDHKRKPDAGLKTLALKLDLTGTYQLKNVKTVLCAVHELRLQGFSISDQHIQTALSQVKTLTGLHGRWEVLSKQPLTICDTGHNPEGIQEVLENTAGIHFNKLHFVLGVVNDKDISKILGMLPKDAAYYFCKPGIPRGLAAESLKLQAERYELNGKAYPSVLSAFQSAQQNAGENDLVFIGGSTFVVAEVV